jgi:hypothetical protein
LWPLPWPVSLLSLPPVLLVLLALLALPLLLLLLALDDEPLAVPAGGTDTPVTTPEPVPPCGGGSAGAGEEVGV